MSPSRSVTAGARHLGRLIVLASALVLVGCDFFQEDPLPPEAPGAAVPLEGFTVAVTDAASPINGAQVVVPDNAVATADQITLGHETDPPAPLADGTDLVSPVLVITRTVAADFGQTVDVSIPFDTAAVAEDEVPIVVYWDESTNAYSPVAIRSVDRAGGKIVFMTAHASRYMVVRVAQRSNANSDDTSALTASVTFDPLDDGFFVHNFGSYDEPGGNSFGMAAYAAWYHHAKKAVKGAGLASLYKEGNAVQEEDDQVARELIARAYQAGNQKAHIQALNVAAALGVNRLTAERFTALSIIQQLVVTRQAQVMAVGVGSAGSWTDGHTVTVYAYDGATGTFSYYDNNLPGEVITVPWKPSTGFGVSSKGKAYDLFAFASYNSAYSPGTLNSLFEAAEAGFPASVYPRMTIEAPTPVLNTSTYQVAADSSFVIRGNVARPATADNPTAQRWAHVYLNGVALPDAYPLDQTTNVFEVPITALPNPAGTDVMILVSESNLPWANWGGGAAWAGGFHSFRQFRIRVENQFFFQNLGFETADFSGWESERHLWGETAPQVVPSDKSEVVANIVFDPIATDLPVPLFGGYAARVNNSDDNLHISTLTQRSVVPTTANPVLRFYWSAVLEDPNHEPAAQPYVEVLVSTTGDNPVEIYKRRFYSNDPTYSGWKSYQGDRWRSIPWQLVELSLAAYAGQEVQLKVEAGDCAFSAHAGYAYLDVEE